MWKRMRRNPLIWVGGVIVLLMVLMALFAPQLAPIDPTLQNLPKRLSPPGTGQYWLGTDAFGRDVWSRLVYGSRISLQVGLISVSIGAAGGLLLGLASGYFGGWIDMLAGRVMDVIMAFPSILMALAIVSVLGPSLENAIIAIGITSIPRFFRVVRGAVLQVREREFVIAAQALGARDLRVMLRHVLPNTLSPVIVISSLGIATAILVEASLSFLGLGVAPPTPTWGSMITDGKQYIDLAPWISVYSGLATMVAVLGFNLLGDGLRDVLDPKMKA
ncbi:MAG: ABC transporter permease [Bacillota bacterium]